jgi:hypothetical protein
LESHEDLSNAGQPGLVAGARLGLGLGLAFGDDAADADDGDGDCAFLAPFLTVAFPHLDVLTFHLHTTHSSCVFKDGHTEVSAAPPRFRNLLDRETILILMLLN